MPKRKKPVVRLPIMEITHYNPEDGLCGSCQRFSTTEGHPVSRRTYSKAMKRNSYRLLHELAQSSRRGCRFAYFLVERMNDRIIKNVYE